MDYCCAAGRDEERQVQGQFRTLRDEIQIPKIYEAGERGGTDPFFGCGWQYSSCGTWKKSGRLEKQGFGSERKGPGVTRFAACCVRQHLDRGRKQHGAAKDDGEVRRRDRQQGDGTEAGIYMVNEHVHQSGGRTNNNRRNSEILGYATP